MKTKTFLTLAATALLFGASQAMAAPVLLGQTGFSVATGGQIDVYAPNDYVYIASGFGQTGLIRIDASNPGAMTQTTVSASWGGGVAVDSTTGRLGTTNGYGNTFAILNPNGSVFSSIGISGCGGNVSYGGGKFGVSTQCNDHMTLINATTGAVAFVSGFSGTGSSTAYNSFTNTFYQDRNPGGSSLVMNGATGATGSISGLAMDANGVTNRVYVNNAGGTQVLDGTTHAQVGFINFAGLAEADTAQNRIYIGSGSVINVYDGLTLGFVDTINLPAGYFFQGMEMATGDDRLYVMASSNTGLNLLVYGTAAQGVPAPAPLALLVFGLAALVVRRRR